MPKRPLYKELEVQAAQIVVDGAGAASALLSVADSTEVYRILTGASVTMSANLAISATGTAEKMMEYSFRYEADLDFNGNSLTIFGAVIPAILQDKQWTLTATYSGVAWIVRILLDFEQDFIVSSGNIADGAITDAKVSAVDGTKISAGTIASTKFASDLGAVKTIAVTVSPVETVNLNAVPKTVITAVPGKTLIILKAIAKLSGGTLAYTVNTNLQLRCTGASAVQVELDCLGTTSDVVQNMVEATAGAGVTQGLEGVAVEAFIETANPAAGDRILDLEIFYLEI